jgi:hypothetical protein
MIGEVPRWLPPSAVFIRGRLTQQLTSSWRPALPRESTPCFSRPNVLVDFQNTIFRGSLSGYIGGPMFEFAELPTLGNILQEGWRWKIIKSAVLPGLNFRFCRVSEHPQHFSLFFFH